MKKLKLGVVSYGVACAAVVLGVIGSADGAVVSSASASRSWVEKEIVKATNGLAKATDIPTNVVEIGGLPAYRPDKSLPNNWYAGFARGDLVGFDVKTFGVGGIYQNAKLSDEATLSLTAMGPMSPQYYETSSNTVYGVDYIRRRYTYLSGQNPLQWDYYYRYPQKSGTFAMAEDLDEKVDRDLENILIGSDSDTTNSDASVSIGWGQLMSGSYNTLVGPLCSASNNFGSVVIGYGSKSTNFYTVVMGGPWIEGEKTKWPHSHGAYTFNTHVESPSKFYFRDKNLKSYLDTKQDTLTKKSNIHVNSIVIENILGTYSGNIRSMVGTMNFQKYVGGPVSALKIDGSDVLTKDLADTFYPNKTNVLLSSGGTLSGPLKIEGTLDDNNPYQLEIGKVGGTSAQHGSIYLYGAGHSHIYMRASSGEDYKSFVELVDADDSRTGYYADMIDRSNAQGVDYSLTFPSKKGTIALTSDIPAISATDPTFSNAVLAVGLNIDTNTVAVLNELANGVGGFPIEGTATTVGGLIAALAAAVVWLKKNKVDPMKMATSSEAILNNSIATADGSSGGTITVGFAGESDSEHLRYCELIVRNVASDGAVTLSLPAGTYLFAPGADTVSAGTNHFCFSEFAPGNWFVTKTVVTEKTVTA